MSNNFGAKLNKLDGKSIAMLGLGIENYAFIDFLIGQKVNAKITICDFRSKKELAARYDKLHNYPNINWKLGGEFNYDLYEFDYLFRSPGWTLKCPGIKEALEKNKKAVLTSAIRCFLKLSPTKNVVGVTGTKGKGTTSSLIYEVLKAGGKEVYLGGNIGVAPFSFIKKLNDKSWVVLELSSFQLQDSEESPHISVLTNFTQDHLAAADPNNPNHHKDLAEYWSAKANIFKHQKKGDILVANNSFKQKLEKEVIKSRINYFAQSDLKSKLLGNHNKENVAAAELVGKIAGISKKNVQKGVLAFEGLEYRIQLVRELEGIKYYNDSFATTPDATMIALKSFDSPIILIAGGADKGADYGKLAKEISRTVKYLVLLDGSATPKIENELSKLHFFAIHSERAGNMFDAVKISNDHAAAGDVVLLSTACASFGMFKNYKERGKIFSGIVNNLNK